LRGPKLILLRKQRHIYTYRSDDSDDSGDWSPPLLLCKSATIHSLRDNGRGFVTNTVVSVVKSVRKNRRLKDLLPCIRGPRPQPKRPKTEEPITMYRRTEKDRGLNRKGETTHWQKFASLHSIVC
jgi:hypothetical protein